MRESELQKQLLEAFKLLGVCYFRMNTQGIMHTLGGRTVRKKNPNKGMADWILHINGFTLYLESKSTQGKLSPEQKEFAKKVEAQGIYYLCVFNLDAALEAIRTLQTYRRVTVKCESSKEISNAMV